MTETDLTQRRILAIVTNYGVEQDELMVPVQHLRDAGATVDIAAESGDAIQTLVHDKNPGTTVQPTVTLDEVNPQDYDLLLVPGGTVNADSLRLNDAAVEITRRIAAAGTLIAAICHGPWILVEAGIVRDKTLTSFPSLKTDIRNAGAADWVDRSVVIDDTHGYPLITSRSPKDIGDFVERIDLTLAGRAA
ncbi:type 1 glutamine amidotransferase domain-containing protein [Nocardia cyriacigeorgica]|uniref:Putative protease n=1 Tax=Nocardia cyriacigeorgica (strain GUH-2) TaxID=1127134 RepID=H6R916_NOCCG|nr:type 1 glutamine amidotransferase domain-containing protein [Nocardia cyriacigeorgica]CCF63591.1 Putative protease [Nocardia cyriacigeorgica GUH-2]